MGEHLVVHVEQLVKPEIVGSSQLTSPAVVEPSSSMAKEKEKIEEKNNGAADEEAPLLGMAECRICQEEDSLNNLENPCACSGSLKVNVLKNSQYLPLYQDDCTFKCIFCVGAILNLKTGI